MALYTINPPHAGTVLTLNASAMSIGTLLDVNHPTPNMLYIKDEIGTLHTYYGHSTTPVFNLIHATLHQLEAIDVLLETLPITNINTYLSELSVGYAGLCLIAQGNTYRFYPVGDADDFLQAHSTTPVLFCPLHATATTPLRFVSLDGPDLVNISVNPGARGMTYPYNMTSGYFTGVSTAHLHTANMDGVDLSLSFTFGLLARMRQESSTLAFYGELGESPTWKLFVTTEHYIAVSVNGTVFTSTTKWYVNEQHHVAIVIDNDLLTLYVDGLPSSLVGVEITTALSTEGDLFIGQDWTGEIQNVYRVDPLSSAEMVSLDWYWCQHSVIYGQKQYISNVDLVATYKLTSLPTDIAPNATYYCIEDNGVSRYVRGYMSDGLARQILPII